MLPSVRKRTHPGCEAKKSFGNWLWLLQPRRVCWHLLSSIFQGVFTQDQPLLEWTHSCRKFPSWWTCIFRKFSSSIRCVLWRQLWETKSPWIPLDVGITSWLLPLPFMLPLFLLQNSLSFTQELGHSKTGTSFPALGQPCWEPPPAQGYLLWLRLSLFVVDVN